MKKELVIIKLGGSVITDKSRSRGIFRKKIVARLVKEIVEAKNKRGFDLILVHGAGSYAHFLTTKYRIGEEFLGEKSIFGYALIKRELFRLNNLVWNECLKGGLPVCTVQPSAVVFTHNGKIKSFDTKLIEALLSWGMVPLLMGDDTIDERRGMAVLSGDVTLVYLARKFNADRVIFVSDVEGVFDKNPKVNKNARLIKEINNRNFREIIGSMETYNVNDASGEMKGKLLAIKDSLGGFEVRIVGGFKKDVVRDVLLRINSGTRVFFQNSQ